MTNNPSPENDKFYVNAHQVGCDGGDGALGHPLVFLELEANGGVVCPYCSRQFIHRDE